MNESETRAELIDPVLFGQDVIFIEELKKSILQKAFSSELTGTAL
jgi:hypothetical protein